MAVNTKILTAVAAIAASSTLHASIITENDPAGASEIGARIRWGATGFEASLKDNAPTLSQDPTLNPTGTPAWSVGTPYTFRITFDGATGALGLSVDFNNSGTFGAGESIQRTVFSGGITDYTGYGFQSLSISGNEGGSTGRSTLSDLVINGTSLTSISPNGAFVDFGYRDSSGNTLASITIDGKITFTTAGTGQERPSWNFDLRQVVVPEPTTYLAGALMGLPLVVGGVRKWRRNRATKA